MLVLSFGAAALLWSRKPNPKRVSFFCAMNATVPVFALAERLRRLAVNQQMPGLIPSLF